MSAAVLYVATLGETGTGYAVTGVGATEQEAREVLRLALRAARRRIGLDVRPGTLDEMTEEVFVARFEAGRAYLDEGHAGEVRL